MTLRPLPHAGLSMGLLCGLSSTAFSQTRRPVISKVEILFSIVSHYSHIPDRVNFYNNAGVPKGNSNYAVPHLVYEPSVTLYNPYNDPLTMTRSLVKIWDPPVGFAFKKNDVHLRTDFETDTFHGLARFMIQNDFNSSARKSFTLSLSSPQPDGSPGDTIVLQPGESMTFSTWVEKDWTWGLETAGGYTARSFFDWNTSNDFTNRDGRTANAFGVEAITNRFPFAVFNDPRAGFQTDNLSQSQGYRPFASLYDFEVASWSNSSWVAIKMADVVRVQAKSMRTLPAGSLPDFQVDLLRGEVQNPTSDRVKAFPMSLTGIIQDDQNPVISRAFQAGQLLQAPSDKTVGGKTPFAMFSMVAKSSALRANRFYTTPAVPTGDLYELQFGEVTDFGLIDHAVPSDASTAAPPEIHGISRSGNTLFIDFSGSASPYGTKNWLVRGTSSLADGFPDNLDSATTVIKSMSGSGIYKAIIDLTGRGERYFVRIEG
jgi:hypothetical protein